MNTQQQTRILLLAELVADAAELYRLQGDREAEQVNLGHASMLYGCAIFEGDNCVQTLLEK